MIHPDAPSTALKLQIRGVSKTCSNGVQALKDVSLTIPVGMYGPGDELSAPLYLRMNRIRSGEQTITGTVPREPLLAAIDPHHLLDRVEDGDDDNIERVTSAGARSPATLKGDGT